MGKPLRYKDSGVDIAAGEQAVSAIKKMVRTTFTESVLTDLGRFGGFFSLDGEKYRHPVLVSSVDGVGTKLKVAFLAGKHDTVGEDLVNHCVNDILVGGAKPLFFLDYIATGLLKPAVVEEIISGMVRGCRSNGCALIGGEMAEMPGFYQKGEYDLAGFIVGVAEKDNIVIGDAIRRGDALIGLPSTGLHTNGFSMARKALFEMAGLKLDDVLPEIGIPLGDALLAVHRSYLDVASAMMKSWPVHGMSHITGGGIIGNTRRILPSGMSLSIQWKAWEVPPLFRVIQKLGGVPDSEMRKTFNQGIGFVFVISPEEVEGFLKALESRGEKPVKIGSVV